MKITLQILLFLTSVFFISCEPSMQPDSNNFQGNQLMEKTAEMKRFPKIDTTFTPFAKTGILVGKDFKFLSRDFHPLINKSGNSGDIVQILSKSSNFFNETSDFCNEFRYLEIIMNSDTVLIDGRNVYSLNQVIIDTINPITNKRFMLLNTEFYGVDFSNNDGLTFCSNYFEPIVYIQDNKYNPQLIPIVKDSIFERASWNLEFDYLELMENDGAYDVLGNIYFFSDSIVISIHREFQEGYTDFEIKLKETNTGFSANYQNYQEHILEE